jgi:hypothetical protein
MGTLQDGTAEKESSGSFEAGSGNGWHLDGDLFAVPDNDGVEELVGVLNIEL